MNFKTVALATAAALTAFVAAPAQARTWANVNELVRLVEATGTTVRVQACEERGLYGWYELAHNSQGDIVKDEMVLCNTTVRMNDPAHVWETLAHESVHVAQACNGWDPLVPQHHSFMYDQIRPEYQRSLQENYSAEDLPLEIEAFYFEDRPEETVMNIVKGQCDVR